VLGLGRVSPQINTKQRFPAPSLFWALGGINTSTSKEKRERCPTTERQLLNEDKPTI
jgi:hypothetical protein